VFVISGALRLVTLLLLLPQFREVRPAEPITPGTLLLRLWSAEALAGPVEFVTTRPGSAFRRRRWESGRHRQQADQPARDPWALCRGTHRTLFTTALSDLKRERIARADNLS